MWVLVDSESKGISLETFSAMSKKIGDLLEDENIFPNQYRLNVSSPGLSRPLSDMRQYLKNKGRTARVKFKQDDQYHKVEGVIRQVDENKISVETDDNNVVDISFENIVETKIIPKI